jgi:MFS family permease
MLGVLQSRTYRHLYLAQVVALVGTGLLTVALGLLAYDLAGEDAGAVLGTTLAIKMVAYVGFAPVVGAFADRLPRRAFIIAMDLVRAAIALLLPFGTQVWEIYILIFLLQAASAAFTPTFQATIPDVLTDEMDYTRALSLSRLASDLESLLSPGSRRRCSFSSATTISLWARWSASSDRPSSSSRLGCPSLHRSSSRTASTTRPRGAYASTSPRLAFAASSPSTCRSRQREPW